MKKFFLKMLAMYTVKPEKLRTPGQSCYHAPPE